MYRLYLYFIYRFYIYIYIFFLNIFFNIYFFYFSYFIYRLYLYFFDFIDIDRSATYIETPEFKIYWSEIRLDGMKKHCLVWLHAVAVALVSVASGS